MERKINYGILGYARIARDKVIPGILEARNANLYAVASTNDTRRKQAMDTYPFEKSYDSYQALLDDNRVDAVYIPLPNSMHKEWAIKAARAGKHILCEKPLALSLEDVDQMTAAARENKVLLMEAFMYRFTTRTQKVKELLGEGIIGEIRHINSTFRFLLEDLSDIRLNAELGGGSLWDVGCYPVNFLGMLMGEEPTDVSALKVARQEVDDSLSAVLRYRNGAIATVNSGLNSQSCMFTEINGTGGTLLIRDTFDDTTTPILLVKDGKTTEIEIAPSKRYVREAEDFADAILNNRPAEISLEETRRNINVILRILKAAR
ncbi:MAG: Gfo/Idh/MocA family oxidoreductase [Eubacteriales bacterium]|nr:Gfo/Idh/MocA family oxidoreductase [Eubacteriales bacterium]